MHWIAVLVVLASAIIWRALCRWRARRKLTPGPRLERWATDELLAEDDVDFEIVDGRLTRRAGVCMRLAHMVKGRFGGTPEYTKDNRLLAARYINDAMEEVGCIRKSDMGRLMYRVRALVFIPSQEEIEEHKIMQTRSALDAINTMAFWKQGWLKL